MEPDRLERRGILFIVSAPSGAGKTTISRRALGENGDLVASISCTTRRPRAGEVEGEDYHFLPEAEFARRRDAGEFAEWARVHDFFYGTPRAPIEGWLAARRDVLLDIDVQGAAQLRRAYPDAVGIFVLPPSVGELESRLRRRATDDEAVIARRLARAKAEMEEVRGYDYLIVNRDVEDSVRRFAAIVTAERQRVGRHRLG